MFKFFVAAVLFTSALSARAQNAFGHILLNHAADVSASVAPTSLGDTMKAMSKILKGINAADAGQNAANATAADQFVALVILAKSFVPDTIKEMPAADQAAASAHYVQMLDDTAVLGQSLAAAFRANDNTKAQLIMQQLDAAKHAGHDEFK